LRSSAFPSTPLVVFEPHTGTTASPSISTARRQPDPIYICSGLRYRQPRRDHRVGCGYLNGRNPYLSCRTKPDARRSHTHPAVRFLGDLPSRTPRRGSTKAGERLLESAPALKVCSKDLNSDSHSLLGSLERMGAGFSRQQHHPVYIRDPLLRSSLPRLGYKSAIWAIAHRLCRLIWKILHDGVQAPREARPHSDEIR